MSDSIIRTRSKVRASAPYGDSVRSTYSERDAVRDIYRGRTKSKTVRVVNAVTRTDRAAAERKAAGIIRMGDMN